MEIPKGNNLDWLSAYKKTLQREVNESQKTGEFAENQAANQLIDNAKNTQARLMVKDGFAPETVKQILPDDLKEMLAMEKLIYQEEYHGLPYFAYYRNILGKVASLVAEQNPDFFEEQLDAGQKGALLSWKIAIPSENDLMEGNFPYLLSEKSGPFLYPGEDFAGLMRRISKDQKLAEKIAQVYAEFVAEYLLRKRQRKAG